MFRGKVRKVHFIGIGGSGMNGIAELLLNQGYTITGSDIKENQAIQRLKELGAKIYIGHSEENVKDVDVVVYSSAVKMDNPEILKAKNLGIPTIPRGEMLAELMRFKYGIAVGGSHGKTTTTSMIGTILGMTGLDPTVVIGGKLSTFGSNAKLGRGEFLVAESDESDGSFLRLTPTIVTINNIDLEHIGFYRDLEEIKEAFVSFANKVPFYGAVALNIDDPNVRSILGRIEKKVIKFGLSEEATVRAVGLEVRDGRYKFRVDGYSEVHLSVPGKHNVYNALASISVALELGIPFCVVKEALESFKNASRRFEIKRSGAITVIDDYAHHPTELRATLSAARDYYPDRRLIAVFQPHRYSRLKTLFDEFSESFSVPDMVVITEVYSAGEQFIENISGELLAECISSKRDRVYYVRNLEEAKNLLLNILKKGDVILTLGAGNITFLSDTISNYLAERENV
ncbi:MAG: UDP-N-acetylmuramate--L-alanine ligase [Hydrogenothermaceae bacterium]|nr:UDP-N-acetylmuramate--L-alanine ligase [Hydrogenothermaceae bacterium]